MALRTPPAWLQAGSYTAENDRLTAQASYTTTGIVGLSSLAVTAQSSPNMTVNVASGWAAIVGGNAANQGAYLAYNDATTILTVTSADPSLPRIDRVVATVSDAAYSGSANQVVFSVLAGTPNASPSAPAVPTNSISLATISIAAASTTIAQTAITDTRVPAESSLVYSRPGANVLINGAMDFWQRGISLGAVTNSYTADRWRVDSGTVARTTGTAGLPYALGLTNATGNPSLRQGVELSAAGNADAFTVGSTWTFSFYAKTSTSVASNLALYIAFNDGVNSGVNAVQIYASTNIGAASTAWTRYTATFTVAASPAGTNTAVMVVPYLNSGSYAGTLSITGVQLEPGALATQFRRAGGTLQGELAACQRYYERFYARSANGYFGSGKTLSVNYLEFHIPFKVSKRIAPVGVIEYSALVDFSYSGPGSGNTPSNLFTVPQITSTESGAVGFDKAGAFTAGAFYIVQANNNANAYIGFSAEL